MYFPLVLELYEFSTGLKCSVYLIAFGRKIIYCGLSNYKMQ